MMKKTALLIALLAICINTSARHPLRMSGYKGFADVELSGAFVNGQSAVNFAIETSHGYQFNPYIFLGGGIGVGAAMSTGNTTELVVPIYGQTRINLTPTRISPYIDFKGGYDVGDERGGIISPSLGVSMPVASHFAVDFGISYGCKFLNLNSGWYTAKETVHSISLDFGFEF